MSVRHFKEVVSLRSIFLHDKSESAVSHGMTDALLQDGQAWSDSLSVLQFDLVNLKA